VTPTFLSAGRPVRKPALRHEKRRTAWIRCSVPRRFAFCLLADFGHFARCGIINGARGRPRRPRRAGRGYRQRRRHHAGHCPGERDGPGGHAVTRTDGGRRPGFAVRAFQFLSPDLTLTRQAEDGAHLSADQPLMAVSGSARPSWGRTRRAEFRSAPVWRSHADGAIRGRRKGTRAQILDTRKTTPGWRRFEKYAVACGGGHTTGSACTTWSSSRTTISPPCGTSRPMPSRWPSAVPCPLPATAR